MFHSLGCSDFFNFSELKLKKRFLHLNKALCEYMRKYQNIYFPRFNSYVVDIRNFHYRALYRNIKYYIEFI